MRSNMATTCTPHQGFCPITIIPFKEKLWMILKNPSYFSKYWLEQYDKWKLEKLLFERWSWFGGLICKNWKNWDSKKWFRYSFINHSKKILITFYRPIRSFSLECDDSVRVLLTNSYVLLRQNGSVCK